MSFNKSKSPQKLVLRLEILKFKYRLKLPDERLIALIYLKRKVRTLQGYSAR